MALEQGGGGTWWDEEERKRKEALGIAGAPKKPAAVVPSGATKQGRPASEIKYADAAFMRGFRDNESGPRALGRDDPRDSYRKLANKATQFVLNRVEKQTDPITEFWKTANRFGGKEKFSRRLEDVEAIWAAYLKPYSRDLIWNLVQSPYTVEQIEKMAQTGHQAMFGVPDNGQDVALAGDWLRERGYNPEDQREAKWGALEYALNPGLYYGGMVNGRVPVSNESLWDTLAEKGILPKSWNEFVTQVNPKNYFGGEGNQRLAVAGTLFMPASVVRGVPFLGKTLFTGVRTAKGFAAGGAVLGGYAARVQEKEQAEIERKTWKASAATEAAMSELPTAYTNVLVSEQNPTFVQLNDWRTQIQDTKGDDAIAIQKNAIELGLPGTEDLKPDGKWTYEWMDAITDTFHDVYRQGIDWQRSAIEAGDADFYAEIDGEVNSEYWQMVAARQDARMAAEQAYAEAEPDKYAFYSTAQIPMTREGREAYARRYQAEGWMQALYRSPLQVAIQAGAGWQAVSAAGDLWARKRRDSQYQAAEQALIAYVMTKEPSPETFNQGSLWSGKPVEGNIGWAVSQVEKGDLANDGTAQKLYAQVKAESARLIGERYSSAYLLTLQHVLGRDYQAVEKYGQDHPDVVSAVNVITEIAMATVNPIGRAGRAVLKPNVASTEAAFYSASRASRAANRAADLMWKGNHGGAASTIGGSKAGQLVREVFGVTGTKRLRLVEDSVVVQRKVDALFHAAEQGDVQTATKILGGNEKVAKKVIANVKKAKQGIHSVENKAQITEAGPLGKSALARQGAQQQATIRSVISKTLSTQYDTNRGIFSKAEIRQAMRDTAATKYGKGESIFPYLRDNKLSRPGRVRVPLEVALGGVKNNKARTVLSIMAASGYHAPLNEKSFIGAQSIDRVMDSAILASRDFAWANSFRNRWAMAKDKAAFQRLAQELAAKVDQVYDIEIKETTGVRLARKVGSLRKRNVDEAPEGFVADTDVEGKVQPLGQYTTKEGQLATAVPDTSFEAYKVQLHKRALWAPYKKLDAGMFTNAAITGANAARRMTYIAHEVSQPLRRYTVAFGGLLLWQKHALTDTSRTVLEVGPVSALSGARLPRMRSILRKRMDGHMEEVGPDARTAVLAAKAESHASEVQYNSGLQRITWRLRTIRDKDGTIRNIDESAHSLRRIAQGRVFREWALGGEDGVRAFFDTIEGKQFLYRSGHTKRTKALAKAVGVDLKGKELYAKAVDEYIGTYVKQEFERLDGSLPTIMAEMKRMAVGDEIINPERLRGLIRDNPGENAIVSMPEELGQKFTDEPAGYIVGKAMQMNKWNRDVVFDNVFNKTYAKMRKSGADPDEAAITAADIASLEVSRIHFDLGNALAVEMKHRWAAWFATKHRLYATYLGKLAIERPMIAAAALDVKDWMEQRNEEEGGNEFDKYDLMFTFPSWVPKYGGQRASLNAGAYFWLGDYPLESTLGTYVEKFGFGVVNKGAGLLGAKEDTLHAAPMPFGASVWRGDAMIKALWYAVQGPAAGKLGSQVLSAKTKDYTEDDLREYLDSLPKGERDKLNRAIALKRAEASINGETIDIKTAYERALHANLAYEMNQLFKPFSGRIDSQAKVQAYADLQEFFELSRTDPQGAYDLLEEKPNIGMMFNATTNAVEKEGIDAGHRRMAAIREEAANAADAAFEQYGEDIPDDVAKRIVDDFEAKVDDLTLQSGGEYNPDYANWYHGTGTSDFAKAIGFLYPLVDTDSVIRSGRMKSTVEKDEKSAELQAKFVDTLDDYGLTISDSSSPLYKLLKKENVDRPYQKWMGYNPDDYTSFREETIAKFLSRGGKDGPFKADKYLQLVEDRAKRDILGAGLRDGRGIESMPFMAFLTPEQKVDLGWNPDPEVAKVWKQWAEAHWTVVKYQRETIHEGKGINATSKEGKRQWELFEKWSENLAAENPAWGSEWRFSRASLAERMRFLGVGTGNDKRSRGWSQFLDIVEDYNGALDRAVVSNSKQVGVGPRSGTAGPITQEYLGHVATLAKENPEWWQQFTDSYTMSKFGFYWRRPDAVDDFMWKRDEFVPAIAYEVAEPWSIWNDEEVQ